MDFQTHDYAECWVPYDTIMVETSPGSPERDRRLLEWVNFWGPALTNIIRPVKAPVAPRGR